MDASMNASTVKVIAVARPTFDIEAAHERVNAASSVLNDVFADVAMSAGGPPEYASSTAEVDAILDAADLDCGGPALTIVLQATFCDASMIARIADRTTAPLVVWSFPEPRTGGRLRLNSLCGANLAAFALRRRGTAVQFVHVDPESDDARERVRAALRSTTGPGGAGWPSVPTDWTIDGMAAARRVAERLGGSHIGVVGTRPDGFEPCDYDATEVARLTGVVVDAVTLESLFDAADRTTDRELAGVGARVERALDVTAEATTSGLAESLRLYGGLKSLVDEHGWSALATRCWPECMAEYGGAVCAPQAMLAEAGVPATCEADLYGAITAVILAELSDSGPFIADLVDADRTDNTSTMWHCGVASLDLAEPGAPRQGVIHPNRGRALLHQFALKSGRVTIARLSQAGNRTSMVIGSGEMLRRRRAFTGTCGVLHWDLPLNDVLDTVFSFGTEHHYGIAYGEHRDALVALAALWDIPVVRLGHDRLAAHA